MVSRKAERKLTCQVGSWPSSVRAARRGRAEADAGVVHQTMQGPKALGNVLDERPDLGEGGQIGDRDLAAADARGRGRGPLVAAAVHDHPRATLQQPPGQLLPDPCRGARHQHDAIHAPPLPPPASVCQPLG
jgi:hypothetical protein